MSVRTSIAVATTAACFWVATPAAVAQDFFWADATTIHFSSGGLPSPDDQVITGLTDVRDLEVGFSKLYWVSGSPRTIRRGSSDGSSVETIITSAVASPAQIALDLTKSKVYWTETELGKIRRADLNGGNVEDVVTVGATAPVGIAIDWIESKVYWTEDGTGQVRRASLRGTNVETVVDAPSTSLAQSGFALDLFGRKLYWVSSGLIGTIVVRANLDGSAVESFISTCSGGMGCTQTALTAASETGLLYWHDLDFATNQSGLFRKALAAPSTAEQVLPNVNVTAIAVQTSIPYDFPTISEWGVVTLAILLLTVGTVLIQRGSPPEASLPRQA